MIKLALTNKLVNAITRKIVAKYLAKKIGVDGKVLINELSAVETDGRVKLRINAEIEMSSEVATAFVDSI